MYHLAVPLKLNLQTRALATDANICKYAGVSLKHMHVAHAAVRHGFKSHIMFTFRTRMIHIYCVLKNPTDGRDKEGNNG